jgi:hypothetical protein
MAAFDPATLDRWRALAIVDRDGTTVGTISEFYLDRETGYPTWALVNTGLFGSTQTFVPLVHASEISDGLQVPYDKRHIKDTPTVDLHDELSPEEEAELFTHYGVDYQPLPETASGAGWAGTEAAGSAGTGVAGSTDLGAEGSVDQGTAGAASSGDPEAAGAKAPGATESVSGPGEPPGPVRADAGPAGSPTVVEAGVDTEAGPSERQASADGGPVSDQEPGAVPAEPGSIDAAATVDAEADLTRDEADPAHSGVVSPNAEAELTAAGATPSRAETDLGRDEADPAHDGMEHARAGTVPAGTVSAETGTFEAATGRSGPESGPVPAEPGTIEPGEATPVDAERSGLDAGRSKASGPEASGSDTGASDRFGSSVGDSEDPTDLDPSQTTPLDVDRGRFHSIPTGPDSGDSEAAGPEPAAERSRTGDDDPDLARTAPVEPGLPGSTASSPYGTPTTIDKAAHPSEPSVEEPLRAPDEPGWATGAAGSFEEHEPFDRTAGASDRWREAKLAAERDRIARAAAAQPEERSPLGRARRRLERLVGVGQDHSDPDEISPADREAAERARRARLGMDEDDRRR